MYDEVVFSPRWKGPSGTAAPRIGISPIHGTWRPACWEVCISRPARAKVSPLPSSTEVSAVRSVRAGIVMTWLLVMGTDTSPTVVSSLISGRTRRLRWFCVDDRRRVEGETDTEGLEFDVIAGAPRWSRRSQ